MKVINQVRGFIFLYEMLNERQSDPYCRTCSAYNNTIIAVKDKLAEFNFESIAAAEGIPSDFNSLFSEARDGLSSLKLPDHPAGQKKAGNCKLPEGVCFVKLSFAIFQKL